MQAQRGTRRNRDLQRPIGPGLRLPVGSIATFYNPPSMVKRLLAVLTLYFVLSLCASAFATPCAVPLPARGAPPSAQVQAQDAGPAAQTQGAQKAALADDSSAAGDSLNADLPDEQPTPQHQVRAAPVHFSCPLLSDASLRSQPPGQRLRPPRG